MIKKHFEAEGWTTLKPKKKTTKKTPNVRPLQMLENKFETVLQNIKISSLL